MKFIVLLISLLFSNFLLAKEDCSPEVIVVDEEANIAELYFYTGTCHYRNSDYEEAAKSWKRLAQLEAVEPEYKELKIDILNNLGYLMFFGLGIEENKAEAVQYWIEAVELGHMESEYHLCHAYADSEVSTYAPTKAKPHCQNSKVQYEAIENPDESEKIILKHINIYLSKLDL